MYLYLIKYELFVWSDVVALTNASFLFSDKTTSVNYARTLEIGYSV